MAFQTITSAEIQSGKPVVEEAGFAGKVKDSLDWLYAQVGTITSKVIPNGDFEIYTGSDNTPDSWEKTLFTGGSGEVWTTSPMQGAKMYRFTHPGGAGNGGGKLRSDYVPVSELRTWSLGFSMYASAATVRVKVQVEYYNAALALLSTETLHNTTTPVTSATRYNYDLTLAAGARFIRVIAEGGSTDTDPGTTVYIYFDDFTIVSEHLNTDAVDQNAIQAAAVGQAELKTSTGRKTGSIANGAEVVILMETYCFSPSIHLTTNGGEGESRCEVRAQRSSDSGETGRFALYHGGTTTETYSVRYTYITASEGPRLVVFQKDGREVGRAGYVDAPPEWERVVAEMAEANGWTWSEDSELQAIAEKVKKKQKLEGADKERYEAHREWVEGRRQGAP